VKARGHGKIRDRNLFDAFEQLLRRRENETLEILAADETWRCYHDSRQHRHGKPSSTTCKAFHTFLLKIKM
jgi:hypothetical protein